MNRTIKVAIVKEYCYKSLDILNMHLQRFMDAYNYAERLNTLKGLTVFDYLNKCRLIEPNLFKNDPQHTIPVTHTCTLPETCVEVGV